MKVLSRTAPPVIAVTTLLMSWPLAQPAIAANLGVANDYNVFVFNDYTQTPHSSDVWGRLAVGGNATAPGGVNLVSQLPSSSQLSGSNAPALVVGGDLTLSAQVRGDALVGGNLSAVPNRGTGTITGALTSAGTVAGVNVMGGVTNDPTLVGQSGTLNSFFTAAYSELATLSSSLQGLSPTGTVQNNWGSLRLEGLNTSTNVFSLTGSQLTGLNNLTIDAPTGSTVVVNVDGDVTLQNHAMNLLGVQRENVLFNLVNASTANIGTLNGGFSFQGSLLAPDVDVFGYNGNFEGTLVANSFTGTLEAHNYQFEGVLPGDISPDAAVPTPALLPGLLGLAAAMRKRHQQAVA